MRCPEDLHAAMFGTVNFLRVDSADMMGFQHAHKARGMRSQLPSLHRDLGNRYLLNS